LFKSIVAEDERFGPMATEAIELEFPQRGTNYTAFSTIMNHVHLCTNTYNFVDPKPGHPKLQAGGRRGLSVNSGIYYSPPTPKCPREPSWAAPRRHNRTPRHPPDGYGAWRQIKMVPIGKAAARNEHTTSRAFPYGFAVDHVPKIWFNLDISADHVPVIRVSLDLGCLRHPGNSKIHFSITRKSKPNTITSVGKSTNPSARPPAALIARARQCPN